MFLFDLRWDGGNGWSGAASNFLMFATLALTLLAAPTLTEIPERKGWENIMAPGVGPKGEILVHAYSTKGENEDFFLVNKGKFEPLRVADEKGFGLEPSAFQDVVVKGYLGDGRFFGARVYCFSGASTNWYNRPFIAEKGVMRPVSLPAELKDWEDTLVETVRGDGAILIGGVKEGTHPIMGDPALAFGRLVWIKDGKVVQDLGSAWGPHFNKSGAMAATRSVGPDGKPWQSGQGSTEKVVVLKGGKLEEATDGETLAVLDNGDVIFQREVPDAAYPDSDIADYVTLHRLRDGKVTEFRIPGQPEFVDEIHLDSDGKGIVRGRYKKGEEYFVVVRAFDGTVSHELTPPAGAEYFEIDSWFDGRFTLQTNYVENKPTRFFVGSVR